MEIFSSFIAIVLILMFVAWLFLKMFGKYFVGLAAFLTAIGLGALAVKYIQNKKTEQAAPAPTTGDTTTVIPFEPPSDKSA